MATAESDETRAFALDAHDVRAAAVRGALIATIAVVPVLVLRFARSVPAPLVGRPVPYLLGGVVEAALLGCVFAAAALLERAGSRAPSTWHAALLGAAVWLALTVGLVLVPLNPPYVDALLEGRTLAEAATAAARELKHILVPQVVAGIAMLTAPWAGVAWARMRFWPSRRAVFAGALAGAASVVVFAVVEVASGDVIRDAGERWACFAFASVASAAVFEALARLADSTDAQLPGWWRRIRGK